VSFVSVTQDFNTSTSMGRLTLNILLSFAQFEREIIGERTRDKLVCGTPQRQVDWRDSGAGLRCGAGRRKAGDQSGGRRTGARDLFRLCRLLDHDGSIAGRARTTLEREAVDE